MIQKLYPALFYCADEASNKKQKTYLRLILLEYSLLLIAAILSINALGGVTFYLVYAAVFVASIATLLTRALSKPEQDWYKTRALAESIKTLTWRYMMKAAPFTNSSDMQTPRAEFREHLHNFFVENRAIAEKVSADWADGDQITSEMDRVRSFTICERKSYYDTSRIQEQRSWYTRKATANKKSALLWVGVGTFSYIVAIILVLLRIRFPEWQLWPIEPVIVFASSVTGWMQIKKFNELSAAYSVTAHEIGLLRPKLEEAKTDSELSDFVNEAELAFSREHTLWIARQTN